MNICSSINKLRDLEYMLQNLKLNVYLIGFSETWATTMNQDILNIKCYNHEQCLRNNKKKGGGTGIFNSGIEKLLYKINKYNKF